MASENTSLYLKGLPSDITEANLKAIFSQYGTVTKVKILPQTDGKPTAAGFVHMATSEEAGWIVENVNGNIPQGMQNPVEVAFSIDKSAKGKGKGKDDWGSWGGGGGGGAWGGGGKGGESEACDNLWVGNLPANIDTDKLKEIFEQYGVVASCKVLGPNPKKPELTAAMVRYAEVENAKWVKENVNGNVPQGLEMAVTINYSPGQKGKAGGAKGGNSYEPYGKGGGGDANGWGGGGGGWGGGGGKGGGGGGGAGVDPQAMMTMMQSMMDMLGGGGQGGGGWGKGGGNSWSGGGGGGWGKGGGKGW